MASVDVRALLALYGGAHGYLFAPMLALTIVGGGWAALLLVPLLLHARTRAFALPLAIAVVTQALLVSAIKAIVGRARPWIALGLPAPFGAPHDGSFPSGHAAGNFCVAAFLAVALPAVWPHAPARARVFTAVAAVYAALVAASRVYLGAHFPSDVIAGAVLGVLVGGAAGVLYVRRRASGT
ncbi:MAG TPA: phosphatase PAP2 family protein [Polyangiaceae bacterium]